MTPNRSSTLQTNFGINWGPVLLSLWQEKRRLLLRLLIATIVVGAVLFSQPCQIRGDDTGIDKARLIEHPNSLYVIEVDTLPRLAGAYRKPVLPPRFEMVGPVERDRNPGYLAIRYRFKSNGPPLGPNETILLPWGRSGVSLTVQWADGSLQQGLFLREVSGIPIEIAYFRSNIDSDTSKIIDKIVSGIRSTVFSWVNWLFVLACVFLTRDRRAFTLLGMFALGTATGLPLADIGVPPMPNEVVFLCIALATLLMFRSSLVGQDDPRLYWLIVFLLGVLTSLSHLNSLHEIATSRDSVLQALLGFGIGLNLVHFALAFLLLLAGSLVPDQDKTGFSLTRCLPFVLGGCAVVMLIQFSIKFQQGSVLQGEEKFAVELEAAAVSRAMAKQPDKRQLQLDQSNEPVNGYLTIESTEVRVELLLQFESAFRHVFPDLEVPADIAVGQQEKIANGIRDHYRRLCQTSIDSLETPPVFEQADFVQVLSNGIAVRELPVVEKPDTAMLGLTFAFATDGLAEHVEVEWLEPPDEFDEIPFAILDPFGSSQRVISSDKRILYWENKLSGFQAPQARSVPIKKFSFPLASLAVLLSAGLLWIFQGKKRGTATHWLIGSLVALAVFIYPYARYSAAIPVANTWQIGSSEASSILEELLTNAFRAFEVRDEAKSYDRLARSVVGDQLREFYLQGRQSLELQNRGGARVRIEKVEVLEINSIEDNSNGELIIEGRWIASGNVNHFGHTHYRNNVYRARVTIAPVDGFWKFKNIQILDEHSFL